MTSTHIQTITLDKQHIKAFAEAISSDPSPTTVPFTYPITFWRHFRFPWLDNMKGGVLLHGEQEFDYVRPLLVHETVSAQVTLVDSSIKQSTHGVMQRLTHEMKVWDEEDKIILSAVTKLLVLPSMKRSDPPKASAVSEAGQTEGAESPCSDPSLHEPVRSLGVFGADRIRSYAHASGDLNPIHMDEAHARAVGLETIVAHGMLVMGCVAHELAQVGQVPGEGTLTRLRMRFRQPVFAGDTLRLELSDHTGQCAYQVMRDKICYAEGDFSMT